MQLPADYTERAVTRGKYFRYLKSSICTEEPLSYTPGATVGEIVKHWSGIIEWRHFDPEENTFEFGLRDAYGHTKIRLWLA